MRDHCFVALVSQIICRMLLWRSQLFLCSVQVGPYSHRCVNFSLPGDGTPAVWILGGGGIFGPRIHSTDASTEHGLLYYRRTWGTGALPVVLQLFAAVSVVGEKLGLCICLLTNDPSKTHLQRQISRFNGNYNFGYLCRKYQILISMY